jgi:hypothetical protein
MLRQYSALSSFLLIASGCREPEAVARFQTDSVLIPDWSVISFSDNRDYTIEMIRVDTTGRTTLIATHELKAMDGGLGPNLFVRTKPKVQIIGRGANWFVQELEENRIGSSSKGLTTPIKLKPSAIVYFAYLLADKETIPAIDDPELLPDDQDLGADTARKLGIPLLAIRATVKNR